MIYDKGWEFSGKKEEAAPYVLSSVLPQDPGAFQILWFVIVFRSVVVGRAG